MKKAIPQSIPSRRAEHLKAPPLQDPAVVPVPDEFNIVLCESERQARPLGPIPRVIPEPEPRIRAAPLPRFLIITPLIGP